MNAIKKNHDIVPLSLLASILLLGSIDVAGQIPQRPITGIVIKPEVVETADIKSNNVETYGATSKWIQVSADFTVALKNSKMGKDYFEYLDNVRVEMEIILPTGHPQKQYALLIGKADYWAFAQDGKEHHIVMFVPSHILKRWAPAQKFSSSDVKKLEIKVTFKLNDAVIGVGYNIPRGKTETEVLKRFQAVALLPDLDRVRNGIYSADKTPWAHLNFDYYELLKINTRSED